MFVEDVNVKHWTRQVIDDEVQQQYISTKLRNGQKEAAPYVLAL